MKTSASVGALALALGGCLGSAPTPTGTPSGVHTLVSPNRYGATTADPPALAARQVDYGLALRTASIKLVGALPTLDEIAAVKDAASYAAQVDKYLADARFPARIRSYYSDMLKLGDPTPSGKPSFLTAPTFAAELVVKDRPITDLFTATSNTCPTLNPTTGAFTDGACAPANGQPAVGVLTDPGAMAQFYSNMSFRRVRWIQESFVCTKFPAEYSGSPKAMGSGQYVSPWPFMSITGGTDKAIAPVNFRDTSSVICANCHTTMNHIAPLFAQFDDTGVYQTTIQVHTPVPMSPITKLTDWLPAGERFSWRFQEPVADLTGLGKSMANDPDVANCQVARAWNWAMSKTDIVGDLATVPDSVIGKYETMLVMGGYKMKPVLRAIFVSDDFVKF